MFFAKQILGLLSNLSKSLNILNSYLKTLRIGEVLKLTPDDIAGQKLLLRDPKSVREQELIFVTQKIADRLRKYIRSNNIESNKRIFPISHEAARSMVKKAGFLGPRCFFSISNIQSPMSQFLCFIFSAPRFSFPISIQYTIFNSFIQHLPHFSRQNFR